MALRIPSGGGYGTDVLALDDSDADVTITQTNVSNIETIYVDTAPGTGNPIDVSYFGASNFRMKNASEATTITVANEGTFEIENGAASTADITILCATAGTSDTLSLIVGDDLGNNLALTGWEDVTISTEAEAITIGGTVTQTHSASVEKLTILGEEDLTITGAVRVDWVDASGFAGALVLTSGMVMQAWVKGGPGEDKLRGSADADILQGGGGDDTLRGDGGGDKFQFEATAAENGHDAIEDFTTADTLDFEPGYGPGMNTLKGTSADDSTGDQTPTSGDIWILVDADGSTDTAGEVADLFGGGGRPFAVGVADMELVLIIQDTQTDGSSIIWYIENDASATVTAEECATVATLAGFHGTITDENIKN
ncbi:MAG: hypothetical protein JSU63_20520 [Phycisphaerales bacterium]|nr:MAG: hypothetical protein JSU63_20520 [Phycisphaerales bacterium]